MNIGWRTARFNAENASIKMLVLNAFRIHGYQLVGAPGWADNDKYDVNATMDETSKLPAEQQGKQISLMVQSLLIERCKFKFHRTTKDLSTYDLVLAKSGPRLQDAKPDERFSSMGSDTQLKVTGATMAQLAQQLSAQLNRTVLDKTGLAGRYDFTLHYAPDHDEPAPGYGQGAAQPDAGPSIFSAIQDQIGLKLVAAKGPVEMIVIDHIEPPSPN